MITGDGIEFVVTLGHRGRDGTLQFRSSASSLRISNSHSTVFARARPTTNNSGMLRFAASGSRRGDQTGRIRRSKNFSTLDQLRPRAMSGGGNCCITAERVISAIPTSSSTTSPASSVIGTTTTNQSSEGRPQPSCATRSPEGSSPLSRISSAERSSRALCLRESFDKQSFRHAARCSPRALSSTLASHHSEAPASAAGRSARVEVGAMRGRDASDLCPRRRRGVLGLVVERDRLSRLLDTGLIVQGRRRSIHHKLRASAIPPATIIAADAQRAYRSSTGAKSSKCRARRAQLRGGSD